MTHRRMTPEQKAEAKRLYEVEGWKVARIGERLGFLPESIKRVVDGEYAEMRKRQINAARGLLVARQGTTQTGAVRKSVLDTAKADALARFAEIPQFDRRSLTGQILGDPLPERSALHLRGAQ